MQCRQCGKDVPQTEGKKSREYCDDACRKAFSRANPDKSNPDKSNPDTISGQAHGGSTATIAGPLSVYHPRRWAYLQERGYVWDEDTQRAYRQAKPGEITALSVDGHPAVLGVTVPGDPAYIGVVKYG